MIGRMYHMLHLSIHYFQGKSPMNAIITHEVHTVHIHTKYSCDTSALSQATPMQFSDIRKWLQVLYILHYAVDTPETCREHGILYSAIFPLEYGFKYGFIIVQVLLCYHCLCRLVV